MPALLLLASFGLDALRVVALFACCLGPGLALVRWLLGEHATDGRQPGADAARLTSAEHRLLAIVAGVGALGTLLSLLALAGGFDRPRVLALLLLAQASWVPVLRRRRSDALAPLLQSPDSRESGNPLRPLVLPLAGVLPVALLLAAYPPSAFDDTMYHLPLAEGLAEHGQPTFAPELRFPAFPLFQETLIAALFTVGGAEAGAHLLSTAELLLLGGVVGCWARRVAMRSNSAPGAGESSSAAPWPAAVATALVLGSPLFVWLGGTAYVDLALALFAVAALWVLDLVRAEVVDSAGSGPGALGGSLASRLALAGALAGVGAAVKYHGLFFLGVAILMGARLAWRRRQPAALASMAVAALLLACPWFVRNAVITGNPVFPFLSSVFGANPWGQPAGFVDGAHGLRDWSLAEPSWLGWGPALRGVARLALDLVRSPLLLATDAVRPVSVPPLSPFAALLPVAAALGLARRETRWIAVTVLAYLALWLLNVRDQRYLAPGAAIMAVLAAPLAARAAEWMAARRAAAPVHGKVSVRSGNPSWLRLASPALLVLLLLSPAWAFGALRVVKRGLPPTTEEARGRYLDRWLPGHALLACAARELGPEITVYGVGTEQLQHFAPGRLLGDWSGPYRYARVAPLLGEPNALAEELREMGADLFLVSAGALRMEPGPAASSEAPLRLLARCQGFELWEVVPPGASGPTSRRLECGC